MDQNIVPLSAPKITTSFWPEDALERDNRSPLDVLKQAQAEWADRSGGKLLLKIGQYQHDIYTVYDLNFKTLTESRYAHIKVTSGVDAYPVLIRTSEENEGCSCHTAEGFAEQLAVALTSDATRKLINIVLQLEEEINNAD
jgi:hypothetical protein